MIRQKYATVPLKSDPSIRRSQISPDELVSRPDGDKLTIVGDIFSYVVRLLSPPVISDDAEHPVLGEEVWRSPGMLLPRYHRHGGGKEDGSEG